MEENRVEATCTAAGRYDEVVYCSVCHAELSRTARAIGKVAHTPGEPVQENVVRATVYREGRYDEVVYCTACGKELRREGKVIPKMNTTDPQQGTGGDMVAQFQQKLDEMGVTGRLREVLLRQFRYYTYRLEENGKRVGRLQSFFTRNHQSSGRPQPENIPW